ncbi:MAG: hypothetical protein QM639_04860 [Rhodocyclaceae bacterium]
MPATRVAKEWADLCNELRSAQRTVMEAQERVSAGIRTALGPAPEAIDEQDVEAYCQALEWRRDVDRRMQHLIERYGHALGVAAPSEH